MDDRLSPAPGGFSEAVAALAAQLPAAFALSTPVIDFDDAPWSEVIHRYSWRRAPRISLEGLPEPTRQELAWWLCSLHSDGERVTPWALMAWVKVATSVASDPERMLDSWLVGRGVDSGGQAQLLRSPWSPAGGGVPAQPSRDDRAVACRAGACPRP